MVPGQDGAESFVIHADHTNMVKYMSRGDGGYDAVLYCLQNMTNRSSERISDLWEVETGKRACEGKWP